MTTYTCKPSSCFIGGAASGPVNTPILIKTEKEMIDTFGTIFPKDLESRWKMFLFKKKINKMTIKMKWSSEAMQDYMQEFGTDITPITDLNILWRLFLMKKGIKIYE